MRSLRKVRWAECSWACRLAARDADTGTRKHACAMFVEAMSTVVGDEAVPLAVSNILR